MKSCNYVNERAVGFLRFRYKMAAAYLKRSSQFLTVQGETFFNLLQEERYKTLKK